MLLGYGYMGNKLVRWGGYFTHRYVAVSYLFIFILCLYMIKVGDAFTEMSPFETKWDEQKSI